MFRKEKKEEEKRGRRFSKKKLFSFSASSSPAPRVPRAALTTAAFGAREAAPPRILFSRVGQRRPQALVDVVEQLPRHGLPRRRVPDKHPGKLLALVPLVIEVGVGFSRHEVEVQRPREPTGRVPLATRVDDRDEGAATRVHVGVEADLDLGNVVSGLRDPLNPVRDVLVERVRVLRVRIDRIPHSTPVRLMFFRDGGVFAGSGGVFVGWV